MENLSNLDSSLNDASVKIRNSKLETSVLAAKEAASILARTLSEKGEARVVVATGNSQQDMVDALVRLHDIDWARVEVFHMDEYVGIPATHPASFRLWVKTRVVDIVSPRKVYYLDGEAPDLAKECERYGELIRSKPLDMCFIGFGENGHIAFNDPHVADFEDPDTVKRVYLDETCRHQQVGEGHFPNLEAVPREALTLTCPTLMSATHLLCCVPERRKAEAVRSALEGPLTSLCPASLVRTHPRVAIFLDLESASLLSMEERSKRWG